jgi:hypothetical protein
MPFAAREALKAEGVEVTPLSGNVLVWTISAIFVCVPSVIFGMVFFLSSYFDIKRRYYINIAVRRLVSGMHCGAATGWVKRAAESAKSAPTDSETPTPTTTSTTSSSVARIVREQALSGTEHISVDDYVPRIRASARVVNLWSNLERTSRLWGAGFWKRTEIFLAQIFVLFGLVFCFVIWFQIMQPNPRDYYVHLGYSALMVVWGGVGLCSITIFGNRINDSYLETQLDLSERKKEILARASTRSQSSPELAAASGGNDGDDDAVLRDDSSGVWMATECIDTVMATCEGYNLTEGMQVFGVRLDMALLKLLMSVSLTQTWLLLTSLSGHNVRGQMELVTEP